MSRNHLNPHYISECKEDRASPYIHAILTDHLNLLDQSYTPMPEGGNICKMYFLMTSFGSISSMELKALFEHGSSQMYNAYFVGRRWLYSYDQSQQIIYFCRVNNGFWIYNCTRDNKAIFEASWTFFFWEDCLLWNLQHTLKTQSKFIRKYTCLVSGIFCTTGMVSTCKISELLISKCKSLISMQLDTLCTSYVNVAILPMLHFSPHILLQNPFVVWIVCIHHHMHFGFTIYCTLYATSAQKLWKQDTLTLSCHNLQHI